MKSFVFSALLLAISASSFAQSNTVAPPPSLASNTITSLKIGSEIPMATQELKTVDGRSTTLQNAKTDAGLLVMFSCNTCPYVIKSQARTLEAMKMAKEMGVGMVIVNSNEAQRGEADSYEAMEAYSKKQNYFMPYAMDAGSKMADAFGATRTPEVYLFNARGILVYKGAMEDNPSDPASSKELYLASAMKNMKKGGAIKPEETKSIGCSIKRVQ